MLGRSDGDTSGGRQEIQEHVRTLLDQRTILLPAAVQKRTSGPPGTGNANTANPLPALTTFVTTGFPFHANQLFRSIHTNGFVLRVCFNTSDWTLQGLGSTDSELLPATSSFNAVRIPALASCENLQLNSLCTTSDEIITVLVLFDQRINDQHGRVRPAYHSVNFCLINFVNYSVASLLMPLVSFNRSC